MALDKCLARQRRLVAAELPEEIMPKNWNVFSGLARVFTGRRKKSAKIRPTAQRRLRIESLESRAMLATYFYLPAGTTCWDTTTVAWSATPTGTPTEVWNNANNDDAILPTTVGTSTVQVGVPVTANSLAIGDGVTLQANSPSDSLTVTSGAISVAAGGTAVVATDLAGANGLSTQGGTLLLSAANSYSGTVSVASGTLIATTAAAIPDGSSLAVGAGATFSFNPQGVATTFARPWPAEFAPIRLSMYHPQVSYTRTAPAPSAPTTWAWARPSSITSSLMGGSSGGPGNKWLLSNQPYVTDSPL